MVYSLFDGRAVLSNQDSTEVVMLTEPLCFVVKNTNQCPTNGGCMYDAIPMEGIAGYLDQPIVKIDLTLTEALELRDKLNADAKKGAL